MSETAEADLRFKCHNLKQTVDSLKKRRKKTRGRLAALRSETTQMQNVLDDTEKRLNDARAFLRAIRVAYERAKSGNL